MKYLKVLGLTAIVASALMAFTGSASATTLTSPPGTVVGVGTILHFQSVGHAVTHSAIGKIECNHTFEASVTNVGGNHGGSGPTTPVEGVITTWDKTGCTTATVHTLATGTLKLTSIGGGKGSLSSTGASVTVETFGLHCIYGTNNTAIGTITGGSPAKFAASATIPRTGGKSGAFCGASAPWTGLYEITRPNPLSIH